MRSIKLISVILVFVVGIATVIGSGGGGGGGGSPSGPVTSTLSFPLLSGLQTQASTGFSASLDAIGDGSVPANGDCSGNLGLTVTAANTPANFEGVAGFSATENITITFSNCVPAIINETVTGYYNSTYIPLGFSDGEYGVYSPLPTIPSTVKVGDSGDVGTIQTYTDNTKAVSTGRIDVSFVVEPDTADTAIVNLISKIYDTVPQLTDTEQDRYRITSTGALTLISIDIQQVNPPLHLVFR